ncbi:MAG: peptidoglycan editing factor PgeF [Cyanobacteria bacterium P01_C01_bin.120]
MHDPWHWHLDAKHPFLTASLLQRWPHGFFTCQSWPATPNDLTALMQPTATVHRAKQVHGNHVITSTASASVLSGEALPEADAVMTIAPQQAAWICTADCTPVLVGDVKTGQVAAIHAGWRGTAQRILPTVIQKMQAQGSELTHLRFAIGPAIAGEVYQVTIPVAATVGRSLTALFPNPQSWKDEAVVDRLLAMTPAPLLPDATPGRIRLDVRQINALQIAELGVSADQVAIAPHCTFQEPERFFSYRRTREKKVQWSGIVSVDS